MGFAAVLGQSYNRVPTRNAASHGPADVTTDFEVDFDAFARHLELVIAMSEKVGDASIAATAAARLSS